MSDSKNKIVKKTIKVARWPRNQHFAAIIVIVAAVILGYFLFIASHAASPYTTAEAESGSLAGSVNLVSGDTTASGNSYVQFGAPPGSTTCSSNCGTAGHPLLGYGDGTWNQAEVNGDLADINQTYNTNLTAQVMDVFACPGDTYAEYPTPSACGTTYTFDPSTLTWLLAVGNVSQSTAASIGQQLVANGHANAYLRIMWEMNGGWYPWGAGNLSTATYITDFQNEVKGFESVAGNNFKYVWNVWNGGITTSQLNSYWPGSAYVTEIGDDPYDTQGDTGSGAAAVMSNVQTVSAFAKSQSKPLEIDEWGVYSSDDPTYINDISSFVHDPANNVSLESYFSFNAPAYGGGSGSINSDIGEFPSSEAAYAQDFSGE